MLVEAGSLVMRYEKKKKQKGWKKGENIESKYSSKLYKEHLNALQNK